jgi:hypothetical protein
MEYTEISKSDYPFWDDAISMHRPLINEYLHESIAFITSNLYLMSTPRKRPASNQNSTPVTAFIPYTAPSTSSVKRVRRQVLKDVTPSQLKEARQSWIVKQRERAEEEELRLRQAEEEKEVQATERLKQMEKARIAAGYRTLYAYLSDLLATNDRQLSSQVTQMLSHHGNHIIESIHQHQPEATDAWMAARLKTLLIEEGVQHGTVLQPNRDRSITNILEDFSLTTLLTDARLGAPNFFSFLCDLTGYSADATLERCKKKDVVSSFDFFLLLFQLVLTLFRFSALLCV